MMHEYSPEVAHSRAMMNSGNIVDTAAQNERFRSKILAKLGNVEDSKEAPSEDDGHGIGHNFADGLEMPSDMESINDE